MSEDAIFLEKDSSLFKPESTRELLFSRVTRFNPAFDGSLPFSSGDLASISKWAKGAVRSESTPESPFLGTSTSGRELVLRVTFADKQKRTFNYIGIKGGGLTRFGSIDNPDIPQVGAESQTRVYPGINQFQEPLGAGYLSNNEHEYDNGVRFDALGARVVVPIMVLEISHNDPGLRQFLDEHPEYANEQFGLIVRAMRHVVRTSDRNFQQLALKEPSKEIVINEVLPQFEKEGLVPDEDVGKAMDEREKLLLYFKTLASVVGASLGKIHESGYWVGNRSSQNTTIAAELTDLGDGAELPRGLRGKVLRPKLILQDVYQQARVFDELRNSDSLLSRNGILKGEELLPVFIRSYKTNNPHALKMVLQAGPEAVRYIIRGLGTYSSESYGPKLVKLLVT